jgi:hypothetical protein
LNYQLISNAVLDNREPNGETLFGNGAGNNDMQQKPNCTKCGHLMPINPASSSETDV